MFESGMLNLITFWSHKKNLLFLVEYTVDNEEFWYKNYDLI